jgi:hypothetical protein
MNVPTKRKNLSTVIVDAEKSFMRYFRKGKSPSEGVEKVQVQSRKRSFSNWLKNPTKSDFWVELLCWVLMFMTAAHSYIYEWGAYKLGVIILWALIGWLLPVVRLLQFWGKGKWHEP